MSPLLSQVTTAQGDNDDRLEWQAVCAEQMWTKGLKQTRSYTTPKACKERTAMRKRKIEWHTRKTATNVLLFLWHGSDSSLFAWAPERACTCLRKLLSPSYEDRLNFFGAYRSIPILGAFVKVHF